MPDQETLPPLYAATLAEFKRLVTNGNGATFEEIGMAAWRRLSARDQNAAFPCALGAYVMRVREEEQAKRLDTHATDPTHTYLDEHDTAILWDSVHGRPNDDCEVLADRQALMNVLCELELVRHRLNMLGGGA
jgi:hypothetical protein